MTSRPSLEDMEAAAVTAGIGAARMRAAAGATATAAAKAEDAAVVAWAAAMKAADAAQAVKGMATTAAIKAQPPMSFPKATAVDRGRAAAASRSPAELLGVAQAAADDVESATIAALEAARATQEVLRSLKIAIEETEGAAAAWM